MALMDKRANILQYAPLQSFVHNSFWHKVGEIKLDFDKLCAAPKPVYGFYTNRFAKSCLLEVDYSAFNSEFKPPKFCYTSHGTIYNKNTVEDFKECDKQELLALEGQKLLEDFSSDRILEDPSLLSRFLILSFADLKCHTYYYWFAFPCPLTPTFDIVTPICKLSSTSELKTLQVLLQGLTESNQAFLILNIKQQRILTLKEVFGNEDPISTEDMYFSFMDASEYEQPSWMMRSFAAYILWKRPKLVGKTLNFLGIRFNNTNQYGDSMLYEVCQNEPNDLSLGATKFIGWEPNRNNRMGPRIVNLEKSMNPEKLAENSINMNLKLMKWRLLPDLNLDVIAETKCLLFGAGTLGCAVARNLLSWGFKNISIVDSGKVGYSNPVRQNLYKHSDAISGVTMKATCAAERLKEINPNAITTGVVIKIPMPGHTVGESLVQETTEHLNLIEDLCKESDALFLLTDSRESRWLPTLLGAANNKIVINAALGFDSFVVMRHGSKDRKEVEAQCSATKTLDDLKCINGADLGCYFCNDVTAPGNSQKDRTLDQQCTVTRPGISNIAASYAVELLVALLQHPNRGSAPAYYSATSSSKTASERIPEGMLGIIPHSIRGNLYNFENILPATQKFTQCIACSEKIIESYKSEGHAFLFKAFETTKYLEDLTGISDFKKLSNEIIDYDDDWDPDVSD